MTGEQQGNATSQPREGRLRCLWKWIDRAFTRRLRALAPPPRTWRGAALGLIAATVAIWLWFNLPLITASFVLPPLLLTLLGLLLAPLAGGLLLLLLRLLGALPARFRWALLSCLPLLAIALMTTPTQTGAWLALGVLLLAPALAGGGLATLAGRDGLSPAKRILAGGGLLLGAGALLAGALWLLRPGPGAAAIPNAAAQAGAPVQTVNLPDPSQPGSFAVETLTYGSGRDRHRPEYGSDVDLVTGSVDGSRILDGWDGFTGRARTAYWGFDASALPLNGRVWYPDGDGPFPLVLIVHGNHLAQDFSDAGYEYLGERLAGRGFIVTSVDENFLNTTLTNVVDGMERENDARGWLLLEHLRLWHEWNREPGHPFYQKVDTGRIALIGHSRGGEAVAVAAAFNRLAHFPDDATVTFDYGYDVRAVAAIAAVDGQYRPGGVPTELTNVNYFAIHGSHDADVSSFDGLNQYRRVSFDDDGDWFKAALYVYRANHGQFNTAWGQYDSGGGLTERFINTAALLPAAEQRQIAALYLSAFLEATLHDQRGYLPIFRDARAAADWLPDTVYLTRYADADTEMISHYEEDVDPATATVPGGRQTAENVAGWREDRVGLRFGPGDNRAVFLEWNDGAPAGTARYTIAFPVGSVNAGAGAALIFAMADARGSGDTPIDLTVAVADDDGDTARLPLSHFAPLQPPVESVYLRAPFLHDDALTEPILHTFIFPLADFAGANAAFDPAGLAAVHVIFDRTSAGKILLDDVGLRR
ncbi:MAG: hypothetical protein R3248_04240 [Candidatus Promineifilaceae bacterium]|nr:hypothetical protein [Candidatus Promineifilaceae bacterium]